MPLLKSSRTGVYDRDVLDKQRLLHEEINLHIDQFNDLCRNAQLKFYYLIGNRVDTFTSADGLPDDFVRALLIDNDGSLWIGTRRGLAHWP